MTGVEGQKIKYEILGNMYLQEGDPQVHVNIRQDNRGQVTYRRDRDRPEFAPIFERSVTSESWPYQWARMLVKQ